MATKLQTVERILDELPSGLALLRAPFPPNQISKLPKETKSQAEKRKKDQDAGSWPAKCAICEGYHHPHAVHLDYVGHAALTDRLLDVDPCWSWEPVAFGPNGLPALDQNGGLWIRLTVLGVTRLGYGDAAGKTGGNAIKEAIGDALRNAAMRFGAALDLWHKGDLHADEEEAQQPAKAPPAPPRPVAEPEARTIDEAAVWAIQGLAGQAQVSAESICKRTGVNSLAELTEEQANSVVKKLKLTVSQRKTAMEDVLDDGVPY